MKQKKQLSRKQKRWRRGIVAVLLLMMAAPFCVSACVCAGQQGRIIPMEQAASLDADCVLVLGALVRENGKLSGILEDRMIVGVAAYKAGASDRLLLSGDHGRVDYDEVTAMKRYALAQDVPEHVIFLDHAGFSTYESLYRARDIFGAKQIVIVTQRYHLYRALYIARRLGLDAYGVASDLRTYGGRVRFEIREVAARCKDVLLTLVQLPPAIMGEPIPLSGDGRVTNG